MIFVTGGARSGKSRFAERLAAEISRSQKLEVVYIATAEVLDAEMRDRVKHHKERRPVYWKIIEEARDLDLVFDRLGGWEKKHVIIVECLALYVSNLLLSVWDEKEDDCTAEALRAVESRIEAVLDAAMQCHHEIIVVSNEVGMGIVPDTRLGRAYRDCLGRANQLFAGAAGTVYLLVSGIPVQIKPSVPDHAAMPVRTDGEPICMDGDAGGILGGFRVEAH